MAYFVNGLGCRIPIMAQGAGLVRDQDYSATGTSWQAPGRPWCLRSMRTVVWSFVARKSTFCSANVVRKRASGARCSAPAHGGPELRSSRSSTFCNTNAVRKRPSGARCSTSGAEEAEGEEDRGRARGREEEEEEKKKKQQKKKRRK